MISNTRFGSSTTKSSTRGKPTCCPVSSPYIQHNPLFPNGLDGIMGYIKQAGRIPCEVKRVAIDGDLAFVHVRYLDWGGQETAGVDIFRFDMDGKIVEHWDVLQPVPAVSNNANTIF